VDRLLSAGFLVDALDDLSQGHMDNLHRALRWDRFHFKLGSVLDEDRVGPLVERADLVFHLAAVVGMKNVLDAVDTVMKVNAGGTYTVLRRCAAGGKRCIVFSSSEVYGNGFDAPFSESQPVSPGRKGTARWVYALSKVCAERAAMHYFRRVGLPVTVVRPFNATGSRQSAASGMVVPSFVRCALHGEVLPVHGTGAQRRTFVAAEDLVDQVIGLALDDRAKGMIVNVGGEEEYSIYELAQLVQEVLGARSRIERVPYEAVFGEGHMEIQRRRPDLGLLERLGHTRPFRPLREVIAEMAAPLSACVGPDRAPQLNAMHCPGEGGMS
jgi:UDP-glucose 4-epimerase